MQASTQLPCRMTYTQEVWDGSARKEAQQQTRQSGGQCHQAWWSLRGLLVGDIVFGSYGLMYEVVVVCKVTCCKRGFLSGCLSLWSSPCRFISTHTQTNNEIAYNTPRPCLQVHLLRLSSTPIMSPLHATLLEEVG